MERVIERVLEKHSDTQINLASEAARKILAREICSDVYEYIYDETCQRDPE